MIQWLFRWMKVRRLRIEERKVALMDRTKVGLSIRANDAVVREAIANGESIFLQVRKEDGMIFCNQMARPTYYSKRFTEEYPNAAAQTMKWVAIDPQNPLVDVELGEDGCWYYRGEA